MFTKRLSPVQRVAGIFKDNGVWGFHVVFFLITNRVRVSIQRILLQTHDIYFQGNPRIIGRSGIFFGKRFSCGRNSWIESINPKQTNAKIIFGDNFSASDSFHLAAINSIIIGNNVLVGSNVLITDHSHGRYDSTRSLTEELTIPPNERALFSKGPIIIEDNVWIADGVKILANVKIGFGSVIAANTVVRESVPAYSIYGFRGVASILNDKMR